MSSLDVQLDPEADALYLTLKRGRVAKSRAVEDGVVLDLDRQGNVLGIEMLDVSERYTHAALRRLSMRRMPQRRTRTRTRS